MRARLRLLLLLTLLLLVEGQEQLNAEKHAKPGRPKEKHCKAESPADDGWISQCSGPIRCPAACPRCHLSCKFCGMIYCPRCNKVGSVCQDPRFIGGDGVTFYFHGHKDRDFCLVSDAGLQVNAHLIGRRPQGRPRDFTWLQALGILFGRHRLYVGTKRVPAWDASLDHFLVYFDSTAVDMPPQAGATWSSPPSTASPEFAAAAAAAAVHITRLEATNSLHIRIAGLLELSVAIEPISREESRVHGYAIPDDDCFAHLEVNFQFLSLSPRVAGVLGQTYAPGWRTPINASSSMPTLGTSTELYNTSSLLAPDCAVSQFTGIIQPLPRSMLTPSPATSCGKGPRGSGFMCRR